MFGCHLVCVALADIAAQPYVQACLLKQIIDQRSGGRFSIAAGNAYFLCSVISSCKFNLRDNPYSCFSDFLDHRSRAGYSGALDDLICAENQCFRVPALFERNLPFLELQNIFVSDFSVVGKKNIKPFHFCEDCGSNATLCSSQYYNS